MRFLVLFALGTFGLGCAGAEEGSERRGRRAGGRRRAQRRRAMKLSVIGGITISSLLFGARANAGASTPFVWIARGPDGSLVAAGPPTRKPPPEAITCVARVVHANGVVEDVPCTILRMEHVGTAQCADKQDAKRYGCDLIWLALGTGVGAATAVLCTGSSAGLGVVVCDGLGVFVAGAIVEAGTNYYCPGAYPPSAPKPAPRSEGPTSQDCWGLPPSPQFTPDIPVGGEIDVIPDKEGWWDAVQRGIEEDAQSSLGGDSLGNGVPPDNGANTNGENGAVVAIGGDIAVGPGGYVMVGAPDDEHGGEPLPDNNGD
jgi:hypothetical protein